MFDVGDVVRVASHSYFSGLTGTVKEVLRIGPVKTGNTFTKYIVEFTDKKDDYIGKYPFGDVDLVLVKKYSKPINTVEDVPLNGYFVFNNDIFQKISNAKNSRGTYDCRWIYDNRSESWTIAPPAPKNTTCEIDGTNKIQYIGTTYSDLLVYIKSHNIVLTEKNFSPKMAIDILNIMYPIVKTDK